MVNRKRRDPYRNFNFIIAIGTAVGGLAALGILRRLFGRVEVRPPGVHVEETPTGTRPIEGAGTSTAGVAGRPRKRSTRTSRQGPNARRKR